MKAFFYYITMSLLLLFGGNYLFANKNHNVILSASKQNLEIKQQLKHKNSRQHNLLKESEEFEVDEEFDFNDTHNDTPFDKILATNHSLLNNWYLTLYSQKLLKKSASNFKKIAPFSADKNPIYLTIGAFRI